MPISADQLSAIHTAAIDAGLANPNTRELLIDDRSVLAAISHHRSANRQLRADLRYLVDITSEDGRQPRLAAWLEVAATLTSNLPVSAQFERWSDAARTPTAQPSPYPGPGTQVAGPAPETRLARGAQVSTIIGLVVAILGVTVSALTLFLTLDPGHGGPGLPPIEAPGPTLHRPPGAPENPPSPGGEREGASTPDPPSGLAERAYAPAPRRESGPDAEADKPAERIPAPVPPTAKASPDAGADEPAGTPRPGLPLQPRPAHRRAERSTAPPTPSKAGEQTPTRDPPTETVVRKALPALPVKLGTCKLLKGCPAIVMVTLTLAPAGHVISVHVIDDVPSEVEDCVEDILDDLKVRPFVGPDEVHFESMAIML